MCGIVAYIGARDATPIILNGLKRLEYRGYDSAGMARVNLRAWEPELSKLKKHCQITEKSLQFLSRV